MTDISITLNYLSGSTQLKITQHIIKHLCYDDKNSLVLAIRYLFNNETTLSDSIKNLFAIWQTYQPIYSWFCRAK